MTIFHRARTRPAPSLAGHGHGLPNAGWLAAQARLPGVREVCAAQAGCPAARDGCVGAPSRPSWVSADRHLERQFGTRPAAPAALMAGRGPARRRLPAGDQGRGRAFPYRRARAPMATTLSAHGDGRWNGVAVLSRVGIDEVRRGFAGEPGFPEPEARAISAVCGGLRVWSVYVPNGRSLDSPHLAYKLDWLAALRPRSRRTPPERTPSPCAVTSTSPRPTTTSGIPPRSRARPTSARRNGGRSRTCSGSGSPTSTRDALKGRSRSPTGTTGPGTSTAASACASTSCSPTQPWRRRSRTRTWTARRARAGALRPRADRGRREPALSRAGFQATWTPSARCRKARATACRLLHAGTGADGCSAARLGGRGWAARAPGRSRHDGMTVVVDGQERGSACR